MEGGSKKIYISLVVVVAVEVGDNPIRRSNTHNVSIEAPPSSGYSVLCTTKPNTSYKAYASV